MRPVSAARTSSDVDPIIPVSVRPGLTPLTRMPQTTTRSFAHVRAEERAAALLTLQTRSPFVPTNVGDESTIDPPDCIRSGAPCAAKTSKGAFSPNT
ncbi:hypothetical protein SAMN05216548_12321 [Faunimonas pinastri]|uniref:Uncharacterized protein n=1 Tax=Faunimonas pinastri TaxID=1855383 RepID=A0A1H9PWI3_9HYPH|nr:hypothetical protein SAMN05216548_12321 [Faunimonas pinastri]